MIRASPPDRTRTLQDELSSGYGGNGGSSPQAALGRGVVALEVAVEETGEEGAARGGRPPPPASTATPPRISSSSGGHRPFSLPATALLLAARWSSRPREERGDEREGDGERLICEAHVGLTFFLCYSMLPDTRIRTRIATRLNGDTTFSKN